MMLRLFASTLALPLAALSTPAAAAPAVPPPASPFGVAPLADASLATIHGEGLARTGFLRRAARDEFESINRLTGATLPVTFDNWFAQYGDALIISNQVR